MGGEKSVSFFFCSSILCRCDSVNMHASKIIKCKTSVLSGFISGKPVFHLESDASHTNLLLQFKLVLESIPKIGLESM